MVMSSTTYALNSSMMIVIMHIIWLSLLVVLRMVATTATE